MKVFKMHLSGLSYHSLESEYLFGLVLQLDRMYGKNTQTTAANYLQRNSVVIS